MIVFALVFNGTNVVVFVGRAHGIKQLQKVAGYMMNALIGPFSLLWILNLLNGSESSRLITGLPIILFIAYDMWYRTLTQEKPTHHPRKWPIRLYIYLMLWLIGGMMLVGYAFIVSLSYGYMVLALYYGSLAAYGYYRYKFKKTQK